MGIYIFVKIKWTRPKKKKKKIQWTGTSLVVQLLRLWVSTAGATGSILVGELRFPHAVVWGKKRNPVDFLNEWINYITGLRWWLSSKESTYKAGDTGGQGLIPGLGKSPGEGKGNPFQYSCLEYPIDRGARLDTVLRITKSWTQLSDWACTHTQLYHNKIDFQKFALGHERHALYILCKSHMGK